MTWCAGMAVLIDGEWPAEVVGHPTATYAAVRFLGATPVDLEDEDNVPLGRLTRPPGHRQLDRKPGAVKGQWRERWTGLELRLLRAIWPAMPPELSVAELRRVCGTTRTPQSCKIALWRWFGQAGHRDGLTMRQVCRLLGDLDHRTFYKLVAKGLLRAERSAIRAGGTHRWAVEPGELRRFILEHPEHYDPRRMPESEYRTLGEQVHATDPLLTVREAARACGWHHHTLTRVIREGRLRATWCDVGIGTDNGCWLIRTSALADLPPKYGGGGKRWGARVARVLAKHGLQTVSARAAELGIAPSTLARWIRRDGYPGVRCRVGGRVVYGVKPIPTFIASAALAGAA